MHAFLSVNYIRVLRQFQFPVGHTYHLQIQCVARRLVGLPSRDASFLPPARVEACVDKPDNQSNKQPVYTPGTKKRTFIRLTLEDQILGSVCLGTAG